MAISGEKEKFEEKDGPQDIISYCALMFCSVFFFIPLATIICTILFAIFIAFNVVTCFIPLFAIFYFIYKRSNQPQEDYLVVEVQKDYFEFT